VHNVEFEVDPEWKFIDPVVNVERLRSNDGPTPTLPDVVVLPRTVLANR